MATAKGKVQSGVRVWDNDMLGLKEYYGWASRGTKATYKEGPVRMSSWRAKLDAWWLRHHV